MSKHNIRFEEYYILDEGFIKLLFEKDDHIKIEKIKNILDYIFYKDCYAFTSNLIIKKLSEKVRKSKTFSLLKNSILGSDPISLDGDNNGVLESIADIVNIAIKQHEKVYLISDDETKYDISMEDSPIDYNIHRDVLIFTIEKFHKKVISDSDFLEYQEKLRQIE
jgi:hypothetical protein